MALREIYAVLGTDKNGTEHIVFCYQGKKVNIPFVADNLESLVERMDFIREYSKQSGMSCRIMKFVPVEIMATYKEER